jgi:hypothetical protein
MIRPICWLVIAVLTLACATNNSGAGDDGDLTLSQVFVEVAPAICHRMQQCDPTGFAQAFPSYCSGKRDGLDAGPAELGRARLEGCSGPS